MTQTEAWTHSPNAGEVREIVGDVDDQRVAQIVALRPTRAELEAAVAWVAGADEEMREERRGLTGKVAAIFELLEADLPPEDEEPPTSP